MNIQYFNFWYFLWIIISLGGFVGLYFLIKDKPQRTQKMTLLSLLFFGLVLHFLKSFIPPYSTDYSRLLRDSWFINICGANIALFPFFYASKNKYLKDYMYVLGILGGAIAVLAPIEPIAKINQAAEWLDVVRFYVHHNILWYVPLLSALFGHHRPSYKRIPALPLTFMAVLGFIVLNQVLQSELGFIDLRGDDIFKIGYKNTSLIWGPNYELKPFFDIITPRLFRTVPVGKYAGAPKYWPVLWMLVPCYLLTPLALLMYLPFEYKTLKNDLKTFKKQIKAYKINKNEP